jgi:S1-C subfamily serine protease
MRHNFLKKKKIKIEWIVAILVIGAVFGSIQVQISFINSLLSRTGQEIHYTVREVEKKVDKTDSSLAQVREKVTATDDSLNQLSRKSDAELGQMKDEMSATMQKMHGQVQKEVGKLGEDIDQKVSQISGFVGQNLSWTMNNARELGQMKNSMKRDAASLYQDLLYPTVQIKSGGTGAGVVIYSQPDDKGVNHTYILTAHHVISRAIGMAGGKETRQPVDIRLYQGSLEKPTEHTADVVAYNESLDIALLKLNADKACGYVARLVPKSAIASIRIFDEVYAVGCPLGHDPMPSLGEVASKTKNVGGSNFWMMNAPTIFGNSGGGIFLAESHRLVGISSMICVYDQLVSIPVSHMGIMVPVESIYRWLDSQCYQFLYDGTFSKPVCENMRNAIRASAADMVKLTWE